MQQSCISDNVTVKKGHEFTITRTSNPSTGYQWNPELDTSNIEMISHSFVPSSKLIGASGKDCFTFKAVECGTTTLKMLYRSGWEKGYAKEQLCLINAT
jgi:predicted secreted protein